MFLSKINFGICDTVWILKRGYSKSWACQNDLSDLCRDTSCFSFNYHSDWIQWDIIRTQLCGPEFEGMPLPWTFFVPYQIMAKTVQLLSSVIFKMMKRKVLECAIHNHSQIFIT